MEPKTKIPTAAKKSVGQGENSTEVESLIKKNAQLESAMEEMKEMMKQMLQNQVLQQTVKQKKDVETYESDFEDGEIEDDAPIIPLHKIINVTSLFYGGMTLRGSNNKTIRFEKFGVSRPISFEDITYICTNHSKLAEEGAFIIHNKDAVKALYLEDKYKKILTPKKIENIIDLPTDQIDKIMCNLSNIQKNTIENIVIQGIIDGNSKYNNHPKLEIIEKYCKKNLRKIASDRASDR